MIDVMLENIQLKIHNVHFRLEDGSISAPHPFALGLVLDHLTMITTNEFWQST